MKRSTRCKSRTVRRTGRKKQHGGAYGYTAAAFSTPGGVAIENRTGYDHCYGDMRVAPAVHPTGAMLQSGGACGGCGLQQVGGARQQVGGGSPTGGYGFQLVDNSLGKVYGDLIKGPCPQTGGAAADEYGVVSYPVGYGFDKANAVVTPSAMYLDKVAYDRTCQGGGARRRSRRRASRRRASRRNRKGSKTTGRRHH